MELLNKNYIAIELDQDLANKLRLENIDLVVNATHGTYGEDGRLPAMLDIMRIPYTHSNFQASQISMNKFVTKKIVMEFGIKSPKYCVMSNIYDISDKVKEIIKEPFVLKPVSEGSSVGVHILLDPEDFKFKDEYFNYGPIILEEYIKGQEVNVVIVNNKAVGAIEVRPKSLFYDYKAKYENSGTQYIYPPEISDGILEKLLVSGEKIHNYIGCRYLSRVEFIIRGNEIYFLEINTHPGFTETSLVPKVAIEKGISFSDIVEGLISSARYY